MTGQPHRVAIFGATGTAGRATAEALVAAGFDMLSLGRRDPEIAGVAHEATALQDANALAQVFTRHGVEAVVSCLASRTGLPADAWLIDHDMNQRVLAAAEAADVRQFVLLSAICVQKPHLAFQQAKLAFEATLIASEMTHSIVRPTAFFKSLSGQVDRLRAGKPFLIFGDGSLTACKPISDSDLGRYMAGCLTDPDKHNQILPIGGPGPAMTAKEIGLALFEALDLPPQFRPVPPTLLRTIAGGLGLAGKVVPRLAEKASLARIGHYYATESMLVWDAARGFYDADATPEFGTDTLPEFFHQLARGEAAVARGDHAVF